MAEFAGQDDDTPAYDRHRLSLRLEQIEVQAAAGCTTARPRRGRRRRTDPHV
jgi:hypothetical protein